MIHTNDGTPSPLEICAVWAVIAAIAILITVAAAVTTVVLGAT